MGLWVMFDLLFFLAYLSSRVLFLIMFGRMLGKEVPGLGCVSFFFTLFSLRCWDFFWDLRGMDRTRWEGLYQLSNAFLFHLLEEEEEEEEEDTGILAFASLIFCSSRGKVDMRWW